MWLASLLPDRKQFVQIWGVSDIPCPPNVSKCGVNVFKRKLDSFLSQVSDDPCETNSDNSIAGAALRQLTV